MRVSSPMKSVAIFFLAALSLCADDRSALKLSLRHAVELATSSEGSARIQLATELTRQAEARSVQAKAALLPQIDGAIGRENLNRSLVAFGLQLQAPVAGFQFPSVIGPFNVFDARVSGTQTLFDLSSYRRFQASRIAIKASKSEGANTEDEVIAQVAKAYLAALRADAEKSAAQSNVELSEALLKQAESLKAAGPGTGIEITRQRVQLANDRQRLLFAQNELRRTRLQLLKAINLRLDTEIELTDALTYIPVDATLVQQVKANALLARWDYKAQLERQDNARVTSNAVKAERLPSISSFANYGAIGSGPNNSLPTREYGVSLRLPIFDGWRREGKRAESESQFRQESIRSGDMKDRIDLDVRLAVDALESAENEVKVAAEGLTLAENEVAQARRRVDAGVAISLEVTDAQTRLARARDNQIAALFHHAQARIDLGQATGTLRRFLQ